MRIDRRWPIVPDWECEDDDCELEWAYSAYGTIHDAVVMYCIDKPHLDSNQFMDFVHELDERQFIAACRYMRLQNLCLAGVPKKMAKKLVAEEAKNVCMA